MIDPALPLTCLGRLHGAAKGNRIVAIERGQSGTWQTCHDHPELDQAEVEGVIDELNRTLGVTRQQRAAMEHGALFGWHDEGARVEMYDENGSRIERELVL